MKFDLFRTIYDARKLVVWMMIRSENFYLIFLLNSHEKGNENTLCHPHVRIMADKNLLCMQLKINTL